MLWLFIMSRGACFDKLCSPCCGSIKYQGLMLEWFSCTFSMTLFADYHAWWLSLICYRVVSSEKIQIQSMSLSARTKMARIQDLLPRIWFWRWRTWRRRLKALKALPNSCQGDASNSTPPIGNALATFMQVICKSSARHLQVICKSSASHSRSQTCFPMALVASGDA